MTNKFEEKQSQRRSDASPTRKPATYRERSNDRTQRNQRHVKDTEKVIGTKAGQDVKDKEQNERGRKLEKGIKKEEQSEGDDNDNQDDMMKQMGFGSFDTTKNKKVQGQGQGAVKKNKKTQFRQYMNREKGFNRALSPNRSTRK